MRNAIDINTGLARIAASLQPPLALVVVLVFLVFLVFTFLAFGKAIGRSAFMPPWGEELTDEQVADALRYLRSIAPVVAPK